MAGLAEDSPDSPSAAQRIAVLAAVLAGLLLVALLAWWLKGQMSAPSAAKRQVARIAILPDTPPPPPPPPPKDEPKPPPRDHNKPPPPDLAPKPRQAPAPANEPIKMEGAAGSGDSPFAAGAVSKDYQGGNPQLGASSPGGGAATVADRAQQRFYAQSARQLLQDQIERSLRSETTELVVGFALWVDRAGAIQRLEVLPSGDARHGDELRSALDDTRRKLQLAPPPAALVQPLRFRLTVRPLG